MFCGHGCLIVNCPYCGFMANQNTAITFTSTWRPRTKAEAIEEIKDQPFY